MRIIDADALKEYILRSVPNWSEDREIVLDCIANSPTIEERKKGRWIWDDEGYHCSECLFHAYGNTLECMDGTFGYCPNCGADMRGGENDGE